MPIVGNIPDNPRRPKRPFTICTLICHLPTASRTVHRSLSVVVNSARPTASTASGERETTRHKIRGRTLSDRRARGDTKSRATYCLTGSWLASPSEKEAGLVPDAVTHPHHHTRDGTRPDRSAAHAIATTNFHRPQQLVGRLPPHCRLVAPLGLTTCSLANVSIARS